MLPAIAPASRKRPEYKPFVPGPNPELPGFIAKHSTPYDAATDRYDVPAFDRDLVIDKAHPPKAIYDMHTYWSKKHWAAVREYIRHYLPAKYYPRGTGLVLDCFSGSGMTGVAAMMESRPCVLVDASPVAAFLSHCLTHPVEPDELQDAYELVLAAEYPADLQRRIKSLSGARVRSLEEELDWLYETKCDRCNGRATTEYVVYSEQFQCPNCAQVIALHDCLDLRAPKKGRYCPFCVARRNGDAHPDYLISTRSKRFGAIPVKVVYRCLSGCHPPRGERSHQDDRRTRRGRFFEEYDLRKIEAIEKASIPHWYPERNMMDVVDPSKPWGVKWRAGTGNFKKVADLYVWRNLWALAAWRQARRTFAPEMEWLDISLSVASLTCSRMLTEQKRAITKGTYYIPQISRCIKPGNALDYSVRITTDVQRGLGFAVADQEKWLSVNDSATTVCLPPNSIDFCFTDPPYLNIEVQYGELNFVWEAWLGFDSKWLNNEIAWNPIRNLTWESAEARLRTVFARVYSSLKPGRYAAICYHDTSEANWFMLQNAVLDAGFEIITVTSLDPKQKSQKQITGEKVVKSDLVLNCRKPLPGQGLRDGDAEAELVSRRVRQILIEILGKLGGQARDKLWDVVLKRLLTRGHMAEHRFDDILAEVAVRSESGRWFLKEELESLSQNDIRNEEEAGAALERFTRVRVMNAPAQFAAHIALKLPQLAGPGTEESEIERAIRTQLIDDPEAARKFRLGAVLRGIEFYDCLFFYLTRFLKGRPEGKTPRRNLAEFLEEYLVRFKDGDKWLYRPPDSVEAESLKHSRQTGLGRRIRQYVAFLKGEGDFPAEKRPAAKTLVAWLKHCSAFGLADEGVLLFEKGGLAGMTHGLTEDDRYDAAEYYGSCKRKASRAAAGNEDEIEEESEEDDDK
jgi:hypothetical protein